jgi:hypothetical protein
LQTVSAYFCVVDQQQISAIQSANRDAFANPKESESDPQSQLTSMSFFSHLAMALTLLDHNSNHIQKRNICP